MATSEPNKVIYSMMGVTKSYDKKVVLNNIWLSYFYGTNRHTDWGALMAGSTLTAIPVVIFFLLIQRKLAFGLTAGAVKG